MSEIKDINKLVIKNSATIELERRKGFVNILLQGNPNLYRAWVERNNKIVIDVSGESTEYNLETQTPDYIEILKNQENDKYYINFIGSIETEQFISDDMTFEDTPNGVRISIKDSKYVATNMISSGTPDYLFVNIDESGNVRIGLTQGVVSTLNYLNEWIEDTGILIKEMKILSCEIDNDDILTFETNLSVMDCYSNIIVLRRYYDILLDGNDIVVSDLGPGPGMLNVVSNALKDGLYLETEDMYIFSLFFRFRGFLKIYPTKIEVAFVDNKVYLRFLPISVSPV